MNYKNRFTGEIISADCYNKLSFLSKMKFHEVEEVQPTHYVKHAEDDHDDGDGHNTSGSFLLSAIIAEETGSTLAGAAIGGDLLGAVVGSELSDANNNGGGDFSGCGSSEDYSSPNTDLDSSSNSDYSSVSDSSSSSDSSSYDSGSDFSSGGSDF